MSFEYPEHVERRGYKEVDQCLKQTPNHFYSVSTQEWLAEDMMKMKSESISVQGLRNARR